MWEYKQKYASSRDVASNEIASYCNKEGAEGWELVHIITSCFVNSPMVVANYTFIFKRRAE